MIRFFIKEKMNEIGTEYERLIISYFITISLHLLTIFAICLIHINIVSSLTEYRRRKTIEVNIGGVPLGAENPIRVQSMTTVDTMDTEGSIEQSIRMVESGCEYVRITAPSIKEAQNLEEIRKGLSEKGL